MSRFYHDIYFLGYINAQSEADLIPTPEEDLIPETKGESVHTVRSRKPVDPAKRRKDTFKSPERHNSRMKKAKGKPRRDQGLAYYANLKRQGKETEIFRNAVEDFYNDNDEFEAEKEKTASFAEQKQEIEQLQRQTMDLNKKIRYLEWKRDQMLNRYIEVFQEAYGEMPDNLWYYAE